MPADPRGQIVPVHARYIQAVEIHWRLADGSIHVERRTYDPADIVWPSSSTLPRYHIYEDTGRTACDGDDSTLVIDEDEDGEWVRYADIQSSKDEPK